MGMATGLRLEQTSPKLPILRPCPSPLCMVHVHVAGRAYLRSRAMLNTTRLTHAGNAAKAMATWGGLQAGLRRGEGLSWVRTTVSG